MKAEKKEKERDTSNGYSENPLMAVPNDKSVGGEIGKKLLKNYSENKYIFDQTLKIDKFTKKKGSEFFEHMSEAGFSWIKIQENSDSEKCMDLDSGSRKEKFRPGSGSKIGL